LVTEHKNQIAGHGDCNSGAGSGTRLARKNRFFSALPTAHWPNFVSLLVPENRCG